MDKELIIDLDRNELLKILWKHRRNLFDSFTLTNVDSCEIVNRIPNTAQSKRVCKLDSTHQLRIKLVSKDIDVFAKPEPTEIPPGPVNRT